MASKARVVVTGLGAVSPLGVGVQESWSKLCRGQSSGVRLEGENWGRVSSRVVCRVPNWKADDWSAAERGRLSLGMMYGLVAAREALADAGWDKKARESREERTGVSVGMGMVDLEYIGDCVRAMEAGKRLSPYFVPRILPNLAAGHIAIEHGLRGPNHSCSTACATGAHSVGEGLRLLQNGAAEVMVCGGVDACISPLGMLGFSSARALSKRFNDTPEVASRPFDAKRDGFVMGEGAGMLVLEREEHALARGARIYCELAGYGSSGDAEHVTTAREDGKGAAQAMLAALEDAEVDGDQVWSVNAHATSTPLGDRAECTALRQVVKESCLVTSNKGSLGHTLGAAGALESIFSVLSLVQGIVPPCANMEEADPDCSRGLNLVQGGPYREKDQAQRIVLKNSFGFGGTNVSLVFQSVSSVS